MTTTSTVQGSDSKRNCFGIRCRSIGPEERHLESVLKKRVPDADVFFVADKFVAESANTLSLAVWRLRNWVFVPFIRIGWRCGDLCLMRLYAAQPDYKYYWLIEPDVYLDEIALDKLLTEAEQSQADFLVHNLRRADETTGFGRDFKRVFPDIDAYACFFPIVRLSGAALATLLKPRQICLRRAVKKFAYPPNDEVFVASMVINQGFTAQSWACTNEGQFNQKLIPYEKLVPGVVQHKILLASNDTRWKRLNRALIPFVAAVKRPFKGVHIRSK